jgi:transposase-like protein
MCRLAVAALKPQSFSPINVLLCLIVNRSGKEWTMPPREWSMAKAGFAVLSGERLVKAMAA